MPSHPDIERQTEDKYGLTKCRYCGTKLKIYHPTSKPMYILRTRYCPNGVCGKDRFDTVEVMEGLWRNICAQADERQKNLQPHPPAPAEVRTPKPMSEVLAVREPPPAEDDNDYSSVTNAMNKIMEETQREDEDNPYPELFRVGPNVWRDEDGSFIDRDGNPVKALDALIASARKDF